MAIETPPTKVTPPPAPDRNTQQGNVFSNAARTWSFALPSVGGYYEAVSNNVHNNALEAEGFAESAQSNAEYVQSIADAASAGGGVDFIATSATSQAIELGSKAFAIETGKAFAVGQSVRIVSSADIGNQMAGKISAASDGSITVDVSYALGSGTFADWSISLYTISQVELLAQMQATSLYF